MPLIPTPTEIDKDLLRQLYDQMEAAHPELWKICYPRIYEEPSRVGRYPSPKSVARDIMSVAFKIQKGYQGDSEKYELMALSKLVESRVPQYWVSPAVVDALNRTTPPGEISWMDAKLPAESAAFLLPRGSVPHLNPEEGDLTYVSYARIRPGNLEAARDSPLLKYLKFPVYSRNGCFVILTHTEKGGHLMHWNMPIKECPVVDLRGIDELIIEYEKPEFEHKSGWIYQPHMSREDNLMMGKATRLVFTLILLMSARPTIVTPGKLQRRIPPKKGELAREFWNAAVIGEHYKMRTVAPPLGGTHASPRLHFVLGYLNTYHVGPQRQETEVKWIEPYWRGGPE